MSTTRVEPTFWRERTPFAFVRQSDSNRYLLLGVVREQGGFSADLEVTPFLTLQELVALVSEVAINHDRGSEETEDAGLVQARKTLLRPEHRVMANWLVSLGRQPTQDHEDEFNRLADASDDDAFEGERQLLGMARVGWGTVRIGAKEIRYDAVRRAFYFSGSVPEWTAEELILLTLVVLSDESVCQEFQTQGSPFLVMSFRPHRQMLAADDLQILGAIERKEELVDEAPKPPPSAAPVAKEPKDEPVTAPQNVSDASSKPEPVSAGIPRSILASIQAAGQTAAPSAEDYATGVAAARSGLVDLLAEKGLAEKVP